MATVKEVFNKVVNQKIKPGTQKSLNFFRQLSQQISFISRTGLIKETLQGSKPEFTTRPLAGKLYLFKYDPKSKHSLPYYDEFPLILVLGGERGKILGLNFHYLPPRHRSVLFNRLYTTVEDKTLETNTRFIVDYSYIKRLKEAKYIIREYDISNVKSPFRLITPKEWEMMIFLPVKGFRKQDIKKVWEDTADKITNSNRQG